MKNLLPKYILPGSALLSIAALSGNSLQAQEAYAPMVTPVVDGVIDGVWDATTWRTIAFDQHQLDDRWVTETDLAARFKMLHDDDGLYLLVDVTDAEVAVHRDNPGEWNDDSIEVFVDWLNQGRDHDDLSGQITFNAVDNDVYNHAKTPIDFTNFDRASVITDGDGYVVEIFIPASAWGVNMANVSEIGFDIHVNDMDVANPDATWAPARRLWSDRAGDNFNTTYGFGTVFLAEDPAKTAYAPMATPVVDGMIEGAWDDTTWRAIAFDQHSLDDRWVTDTDLAARFKTLHDDDGLYVLVDVTDSVVAVHRENPGEWNDDSIEIFVDWSNQNRDHDDLSGQITFNAVDNDVYNHGKTPIDFTNFDRASVITDGVGYVVEIFIPASAWGVNMANVSEIGFDIHVNDMDVSNPDATWAPARRLWSDRVGDNFNTTSGFGTVFLAEDPNIWYGFSIEPGDFVDTGSWMGYVWIGYDPYVWVYNLGRYVYLIDDSGWVYLSK